MWEAITIKTQTSIDAHNYRLQEWTQMIQECNQRPYGMSVSEWCQENSITKANYYYRMSQVRKACVDSLPAEAMELPIVPVPAQLMNSEDSAFEEPVQREKESYIEISAHGMTLKITENTSSPLIAKVLGVLAHVE